MDDNQEFCIKWSKYHQQISEALRSLLKQELLVDCTLSCDGRSVKAHRTILSACSSYFQVATAAGKNLIFNSQLASKYFKFFLEKCKRELFKQNDHPHPIIILTNVKYEELEALVHFMYNGEVTMHTDTMSGFLRVADIFKVHGLTYNVEQPIEEMPSSETEDLNDECVAGDSAQNYNILEENKSNQKKIKLEHTSNLRDSIHSMSNTDNFGSSSLLPKFEVETNLTTAVPPSKGYEKPTFSSVSMSYTPGFVGRPFRHRVMWNLEQSRKLEEWYNLERYPSGQTMKDYATFLANMNPTDTTPSRQNVDYWFQNRRRRDTHPDVLQQREKKKISKCIWPNRDQSGGSDS